VQDPNRPALSLSGGAASGAFAAGFMYAMLSTREQARVYGSPAQSKLLDQERFGSASGSSVGSLIGVPLDLYFTDAKPPSELRAGHRSVPAEESPQGVGARRARAPAVCAGDARGRFRRQRVGPALRAARLGARSLEARCQSLLKFDPLDEKRLGPFFHAFGRLTRDNAFRRTVIAADLGQGVLGVIDERACRLPGMNAEACRREAILASVSEPILAPTRAHLLGFDGPRWRTRHLVRRRIAKRESRHARGRGDARQSAGPQHVPRHQHAHGRRRRFRSVILGTLTSIGIRMIGWETSYAGLEQHRQRVHACEVGRMIGITSLCPNGAPGAAAPTMEPQLLSVSVPDDIAPAQLFATGYTFDPIVMRGLFLWGQRAFFRSRAEVLDFLDWCVPSALERGAACPGGEGRAPPLRRRFEARVGRHERARWVQAFRGARRVEETPRRAQGARQCDDEDLRSLRTRGCVALVVSQRLEHTARCDEYLQVGN
jgi:hypothetical protein